MNKHVLCKTLIPCSHLQFTQDELLFFLQTENHNSSNSSLFTSSGIQSVFHFGKNSFLVDGPNPFLLLNSFQSQLLIFTPFISFAQIGDFAFFLETNRIIRGSIDLSIDVISLH
jgi:hypothetical protein